MKRLTHIGVNDGVIGAFVVGIFTPLRVVQNITQHHQLPWLNVLHQTADAANRAQIGHTDFLQRPDIGTKIDLMRCERVAVTVAIDEGHFHAG